MKESRLKEIGIIAIVSFAIGFGFSALNTQWLLISFGISTVIFVSMVLLLRIVTYTEIEYLAKTLLLDNSTFSGIFKKIRIKKNPLN